GVLTLQQALYHAAHDYTGGLPVVAAHYGWNHGTLRNKLSLTLDTHKPTLEDAERILDLTRDARILTAICEPVGAVWHWSGEVNDSPADLDVLARGSALMGSATGVIDELVKALDDGQIDAVEMSRIRQKMFELQQELQAVKQTAEQFEVEG
ncbi:MAG: phage regulatory CII family protein, partial [Pontibacterium sp.]